MIHRKGFTLLELMIVIIIVGVLATLGVMQYQSAIERSRGAEARQVIGQLRTMCAAHYIEDRNTAQCTNDDLGIGNDIPGPNAGDCEGTNYFRYAATGTGGGTSAAVIFTATRCSGGADTGKTPQGRTAGTLTLTIDYSSGSDVWDTTVGY